MSGAVEIRHFLIRLEFGEGSPCVQKCLQGTLGAYISRADKGVKEQGQSVLSLYLDKTPEEIERRQRRRCERDDKGRRGRGKGKGGRGRAPPEGGH